MKKLLKKAFSLIELGILIVFYIILGKLHFHIGFQTLIVYPSTAWCQTFSKCNMQPRAIRKIIYPLDRSLTKRGFANYFHTVQIPQCPRYYLTCRSASLIYQNH